MGGRGHESNEGRGDERLVTYWPLDMLGSGDRVWLALLLAADDDDKGSLWEVGFICGVG
jgi:hypothetical protein